MERAGTVKQFFTRPGVVNAGKIIISLSLLWGLLYYLDDESIVRSFRNANLLYLFIGLVLALLQFLLFIYRWKYLLHLISREIPLKDVVTSFFVGVTAGFFTPVQVGEFAGRIASHPDLKKSHVVGMTLIDKLYRAILTFIIGGTGLILYIAEYLPEYWNSSIEYPALFLLVLLTLVFLFPRRIKQLFPILPEKIRTHRLYRIIDVIDSEFHNRNARILFLFTLVLYLVILMENYFLSLAFGDVALIPVILCVSSVLLIKATILPISFGDLGVRESASVFFYEHAGMAAAVAFNASIVMSFVNVIIPTAIGALLIIRLKRKSITP